jgi:hypothetical protein
VLAISFVQQAPNLAALIRNTDLHQLFWWLHIFFFLGLHLFFTAEQMLNLRASIFDRLFMAITDHPHDESGTLYAEKYYIHWQYSI